MSRSVSAAIRRIDGPWPAHDVGLRTVGGYLDMTLPLSLSDMLDQLDSLPTTKTWHADVTMEDLALGGVVDVTINADGSWAFGGRFHDSGFDAYDFRVVAVVRGPDDLVVDAFVHGGHVSGSTGSGSRDHRWLQRSALNDDQRLYIQTHWPALVNAVATVQTRAEDVGWGGSLVSVLEELAAFVLADVLLGPAVATALLGGAIVGSQLDGAGGPGELVGLFVAGGAMFLVANGIFVPVVPLGLLGWAATDAVVRHRPITVEEETFANQVFKQTLPPREKVILTNLAAVPGRAFVWPNVDGGFLVNMVNNSAFDNPVHFKKNADDPEGKTFIHELTHVWQARHVGFAPITVCDGLTGQGVSVPVEGKTAFYDPGLPGLPWASYNNERQAVIVARWFTGGAAFPGGPSLTPMSRDSPWFRYIAENIWLNRT